MALWAQLFVSTKRNRGHIGSNTPSQSAANKASASNDPGATGDRRRDVAGGSLGVESCEATRREREPGVLLAEVVSRREAESRTDAQLVPVKVADDRSVDGREGGGFPPAIGNP